MRVVENGAAGCNVHNTCEGVLRGERAGVTMILGRWSCRKHVGMRSAAAMAGLEATRVKLKARYAVDRMAGGQE